eukprot:12706753-Alexandrium_andersonii.AAC.1
MPSAHFARARSPPGPASGRCGGLASAAPRLPRARWPCPQRGGRASAGAAPAQAPAKLPWLAPPPGPGNARP